MRIGNLDGRLTLFRDGGAVDVEQASGGVFSEDPQAVYRRWDEFCSGRPSSRAYRSPTHPTSWSRRRRGLNKSSASAQTTAAMPPRAVWRCRNGPWCSPSMCRRSPRPPA